MRSRLLLALALLFGCRAEEAPQDIRKPAAAGRPVLVFIGDSLTAGYGVAMEEAYPALLAARWPAFEIRNAGVSGSTSAGILENLAWNLTPEVDFVFLAIGANDGLRGLDLDKTRENIEKIIAACQSKKIRVSLAGIKIPPNYGYEYTAKFEDMYPSIAKQKGVGLMPFLLQGVGGQAEMNQEDGIHPNPAGHAVIAGAVEKFLKKEGWLQ